MCKNLTMKKLLYFLFVLILVSACGLEKDNGIDSISGSYSRLLILNDFMYAINNEELTTFDISDKNNPVLVNRQDVGFRIENIFHRDGILFIGSSQQLYIFELNDKGIPVRKTSVSYFGGEFVCSFDPVIVSGNYAYVTLSPFTAEDDGRCFRDFSVNELRIYDVTKIENPVLLTQFPLEIPKGLAIDNNYLFVCEKEKGVKVIDVSDKVKPKTISELYGFQSYDVLVRDKILYVVGTDQIREYDYSDIDNIKLISTIRL